jgi:hypothetical protein
MLRRRIAEEEQRRGCGPAARLGDGRVIRIGSKPFRGKEAGGTPAPPSIP